jgi:FtsP/CotA-like multicopper oxidase with cupredoxin domain
VTTAQRLGILAATVVVLVLAFVLLRPGGDSGSTAPSASTAQPAVKTVHVVGGKPQGGIQTLSFVKGDRVRLRVVSDVADEIHVHGYDLKKDVEKGGSVEFSFPATIEGVFEVELEHAATQIASLEVRPS